MKRLALLGFFALTFATSLFAADLPPGRWWKRPDVIQALGLSDEQQSRLESAFETAGADLIDLKAAVDKASLALRVELDQPQLDRQKIRAIAARLSDARGKLFDRELMMLVDMRAVLSDEQWIKMRRFLDRLANAAQMPQRPKLRQ